ncbi:MAG: hypothetical protein HYU84_11045 [Chloroflexi bacterium]|nr:hypothetical protein [Chloroflexota bacterium]MBI3166855.1 hypothetical protein [Chloroflexota bacterium]
MFRRESVFLLSVLLIAALSACNLPSGEPTETEAVDSVDLELTITALAGTPTVPQDTATPQFTATTGPSATPSVPQVTVTTDTNCRTGPGKQYDNIGALLVGQVGIVVGKNTSTGYWIINNPGKTGTCWLFPQFATVSGNTANLQEYSIPPTPTPSPTPTFTPTPTLAPPAPINNPTVAKVCILINPGPPQIFSYTGTLNWEDKSNNEDGFNIYFNGGLFANVPANSTSYAIPPLPFPAGTPTKWGVEAFNAAGKAAIKEVITICP